MEAHRDGGGRRGCCGEATRGHGRPREANFRRVYPIPRQDQPIEKKISKMIRDNFQGWSRMDTHILVVGDRTIYQELTSRWLAKLSGDTSVKFGKGYYHSLRQEFGRHSMLKDLEVADEDEPMDDVLSCALQAPFFKFGNRAPFF